MNSASSIYLDHAATTPVYPEVVESMLPYLSEYFGNASSTHWAGRQSRAAVNSARDRIAEFVGCAPSELIFTGSGTESDNTAIFGAVEAAGRTGDVHIITTATEHHAVLHACERLERLGCSVTRVGVDVYGRVDVREIEEAIRPETVLISVMYGNNEVGTLQPIEEIGRLAQAHGILFHVDAVQALAHIPIQLRELPVDLMSFSAHKLGGPKGIGALYIRRTARIAPMLYGGSQERGRRAGTENTAGIAGFARAVQIFEERRYVLQQKMEELRQLMIQELEKRLGPDAFTVNGHPDLRLPHILNVSFPGISTESMLMNLDLSGVAASSGSACTSGSLEVSHVLQSMGLPPEITASAVRFSFGESNSTEEVVRTASLIAGILERLRK